MFPYWTLIFASSVLLLLPPAITDVAHLFAEPAEFGSYQQLDPGSFQLPLLQSTPYGRPGIHKPAIPVSAPTTELSLPEIIENRSVKGLSQGHGSFIPLGQNYLASVPDERPSYEALKPSDDFSGYYYVQPSLSSTTRTPTTTTTQRPIIVQDPGEENQIEQSHSSGYDYQAPPKHPLTPASFYLPPVNSNSEKQQLRMHIKDMRCLRSGYFRAILKLDSFLGAPPVLDNNSESQDKHCELKMSRSFLLLDIDGTDFERCGVRVCGQDLCLRLRFPAIRGLRTASDSILTLHCKTQERVAVKVHALRMGVANEVQSRSTGTHAHGGNQNPFRTHVELLRRGPVGYTQHLESNGAVQLGEELLLRASVLPGDGWNHTKLSEVVLQRLSDAGELLNSAQLINSHGCLNPAMQSICSHAPSFESPLGQRLSFRAIMFPGMQSGDLLVISMRITGCLESEDCQVSVKDCQPGIAQRRRRDTSPNNGNATEASELSHFTFRVIMSTEEQQSSMQSESEGDENNVAEASKYLVLFGSLGFLVLLLGVAVIAVYKLGR